MSNNNGIWKSNDGMGVKIVVVDSGIYIEHPKLLQYNFNGFNILDNSDNIMDYLGHGTAIVGIIKQHAPMADIFMMKIFDKEYMIDFEDLCKGLEYIEENISFDILNLSIGVTECEDYSRLKKICERLSQKGIIISAFDNFGAISYPAAFSFVIGVDSQIEYIDPLSYDMILGDIINVRGKGGNQRVLWNEPEYLVQSGSSFTCAHITGIVAKIIQGKKCKIEDVRCELEKNAIKTYMVKKYYENKPKFKIRRAICLPYNKEIDTIIRNEDILDFKLVDVYDIRMSINIGKSVGRDRKIKPIEEIDWEQNFDTVILGHIKEVQKIVNINYYEEILRKCKKYNKNIFLFDDERGIDNTMYSPNILEYHIPPLNYGKLYMIGKPVVAIVGTSSQQGKFTLQLLLRNSLKKKGYKVGQLGTEPQSLLFDFDECFHCGFGTELFIDELTAIMYINHLLHNIECKNPDIIVLGGQSGLLPYATYNIRDISPYQRELLIAANTDAIILCINYFDEIEYILKTIFYAECVANSKVIALVMFPFEKSFTWNAVSRNYKPVNKKDLQVRMEQIEKDIKIKVYLQSDIDKLCMNLINYLSE